MKRRLIIHSLIGAGLIAAWVAFIYLPLSKERKAVDVKIRETDRQLQDIRQSVELLPVFLQTRDQLKKNRRDLDSRLFGKSEILELFRELQIVADAHKLRLVEVSPPLLELLNLEQTMADTSSAPFLTLRLTMEGSYTDFGRFVEELEQADFYRTPERCQIQAAKKADQPTQFHLDFKALLGETGGPS